MATDGNNGDGNGGELTPYQRRLACLRPPWKKGQSGNPKGRPKGRTVSDKIKRLLIEAEDGKFLEAFAKVGLKAALGDPENGVPPDFRYWKEIMDRIEGKVAERIQAGDEGGSIFIGITSNGKTPDED